MAWPTKTDFVDGDVLTAAQVNNIGTNLNLANPTGITDGYVLTADGAGSMGWEAVSANAWTSLATGNMTTTAVNITGIPGTYRNLHLFVVGLSMTSNSNMLFRINGQTGNIHWATMTGASSTAGTQSTRTDTASGSQPLNFNFMDAATSANFFYIQIPNYASTTSDRAIPFWTRHNSTTSTPSGAIVAMGVIGITGYMNAITEINLLGGTAFDAGTYVLYGEK